MVRQLHDGMMARVTNNRAVKETLTITNGVKQRCALTPPVFNLTLSVLSMDFFRDERPGIRIAYRMDCQLLNQRRMHFSSSVCTTNIHEQLFEDKFTLNETLEGNTQKRMYLFACVCNNFVLTINTIK
ncbi:unnamed protein product [Schistocephalus solidus]|uniref:Reverse transcriptase domain-containing protein n=1 Tax=Schistocephalus solidus TaxID=70667 RepID=A0A183T4Z9_SCHSO|nr:unnamed protein product [Schistocephalus solidus]